MPIRQRLRKGLRMLGSLLIGERLVSEEQVRAALAEQQQRKLRGWPHKRLGAILVEMSVVGLGDVARVAADQKREREAANRQADLATPSVVSTAEVVAPVETPAPEICASNNGRVYHLRDCGEASKINETNLVWFSSGSEAAKAGKRPCRKCC